MATASDYTTVLMLIGLTAFTGVAILVLSHLVGPRVHHPVKHSTYESGMEPVGDTRRRFSVGFYLIAVLFLIFDVELLFFYPWAILYPRLRTPADAEQQAWADSLAASGYSPNFLLVGIGVFFALLLVGFLYEWRRGVFKWN